MIVEGNGSPLNESETNCFPGGEEGGLMAAEEKRRLTCHRK